MKYNCLEYYIDADTIDEILLNRDTKPKYLIMSNETKLLLQDEYFAYRSLEIYPKESLYDIPIAIREDFKLGEIEVVD